MVQDLKKSILNKYQFGDMEAVYFISEDQVHVELQLIPLNKKESVKEFKFTRGDSLVQAKLIGDIYPGSYAGGMTMRNSGTVKSMHFVRQEEEKTGNRHVVRTVLADHRQHVYVHELTWTYGDYSLGSRTTFINESNEKAELEMLSSFSISEMTPFEIGDAHDCLQLHRIRSKWSNEGRLITETLEDLQLEPNWVQWQPNSIRFGQVGSMPVKGYFPFAALEDTRSGVVWGVQLGIESSWQIEVYRRDEGVALSGGLADREFGQWVKEIAPGESFTTPEVILTVCCGSVDHACQRLTQFGEKYLKNVPESEQNLPVLFNEYCTTWGLPSHDTIERILTALKGKGISYFVIDCGWFVEEGKSWGEGMGDYIPSKKLFPNGMKYTADRIREMGMRPGLWFEIDNVGKDASVYERDEFLLKRDGHILTTGNRRFFDMKKEEVQEYLYDKVICQLKEYGFDYIKMDYNDTIGLGCDGAESMGEGLRQNMEASTDFVRRLKKEIPGLIIENCASGGHKLEPLMMSLCSMASFSDAHECEEIPVIAANLHRIILPRQSQIWAVIRKTDSSQRIAYSLINTFLGRMCLSGDVTELTGQQWETIECGIAFYRQIVPIVRFGYSYIISDRGSSDRHLTGYQAVVRVLKKEGNLEQGLELYEGVHDMAYVTVHVFRDVKKSCIEITLPKDCPNQISRVYAGTAVKVESRDGKLFVYPTGEMEAAAVLLVP